MLLTLNEVAQMMLTTPRTIQRWVKAGQFPAPKRYGGGGRPRWLRSDIETYQQAGTITAYRIAKRR